MILSVCHTDILLFFLKSAIFSYSKALAFTDSATIIPSYIYLPLVAVRWTLVFPGQVAATNIANICHLSPITVDE